MKSLGKCLTFALVALGIGITAAPAFACNECSTTIMTQPAVIEPVLTQPAVVDSCAVLSQPAVIDSCAVLSQPAVIDTCTVQPAVLDTCNTVITQPAVIERPRRHLFNLGTPLFNLNIL